MIENKRKSKKKIILICILSIIIVSVAGFFIYVGDYYHSAIDVNDMKSKFSELSYTEENNLLTIKPQDSNTNGKAIIFYPGAKVEYTSYGILMSLVAEKGYTCFVVKMPFNFAFFNIDAASNIMADDDDIEEWYIAGHSLGGTMAASYAHDHSSELKGLILLAAYGTDDFSGTSLDILSVYGSNDNVLDKEKVMTGFDVEVIEGGNHAGFGTYGPQDGDGKLTISADEQRQMTADYITEFAE